MRFMKEGFRVHEIKYASDQEGVQLQIRAALTSTLDRLLEITDEQGALRTQMNDLSKEYDETMNKAVDSIFNQTALRDAAERAAKDAADMRAETRAAPPEDDDSNIFD